MSSGVIGGLALASSIPPLAQSGSTVPGSVSRRSEKVLSSRKGKRVLIIAGDASEGLETYYCWFRLRELGVDVRIATTDTIFDYRSDWEPYPGILKSVVHDFEPPFETYTEKTGYLIGTLAPNLRFSEVDLSEYDGLISPGGRAPEWIRQVPECQRIVKHFVDEEKLIGTLCHGPQVLFPSRVPGDPLEGYRALDGRTMTAYPPTKLDIEAAGATFIDKEVVVDDTPGKFCLVSSRGWGDLAPFMREFVKKLQP